MGPASGGVGEMGRFNVRRWVVVLAASLVLPLVPAVAGAQTDAGPLHAEHSSKNLRVVAPRNTVRGSVVLSGQTFARASVRIVGGTVPVTTTARPDGKFTAEIVLRPD